MALPKAPENFWKWYICSLSWPWWQIHRCVNMLKLVKLYIAWSLLYINYTSLMLFLKSWIHRYQNLNNWQSSLYAKFTDNFSSTFLIFFCILKRKRTLGHRDFTFQNILSKSSDEQKTSYKLMNYNVVAKKKKFRNNLNTEWWKLDK